MNINSEGLRDRWTCLLHFIAITVSRIQSKELLKMNQTVVVNFMEQSPLLKS